MHNNMSKYISTFGCQSVVLRNDGLYCYFKMGDSDNDIYVLKEIRVDKEATIRLMHNNILGFAVGARHVVFLAKEGVYFAGVNDKLQFGCWLSGERSFTRPKNK